eukprot:CAMPEP_0205825988 /NCGR_PEP_ID=MMETSP0206-20130828/27110_1 /ASSEMBLY_ACC=CAM_ASM_000279 /TAXON_ID=36767 /ORGANISM="Euplotes focardii, Strain TN1" /LENGTH=76 /DNA_ID=CAMNT_0053125477 /DNA_START=513 /DNA_END=743 /DNA_ORIENTATION=+
MEVKDRKTAKWNTEFVDGNGQEEGIYVGKKMGEEDFKGRDAVVKKSKVQKDRKKWEELIVSENTNTFFFDSDNSND